MASWLKRVLPFAKVKRSGQSGVASISKAQYQCDLDEEPVQNYKPGGYHPVQIGDKLNGGRYKVLHKVGWGGFSTVWAAKDLESGDNVALKIVQAAASGDTRGLQTLKFMKESNSNHPGFQRLVKLHEVFQEEGPNGKHNCLVLDLTGPSVQDYINRHVDGFRLPGQQAKSIAKQALQALSCLHSQGICHGDLHNQNLALGVPQIAEMDEEDFYEALGKPKTEEVTRTDGGELEPNVPSYLVKPSSFAVEKYLDYKDLKLVDFGASFRGDIGSQSLLNPPVIRAPEQFFGDKLDHRVDLWSMGCTLFELVCGQTPFESGNSTPESIAKQMIYMVKDEFPERWQDKRKRLEQQTPESPASTLQQWLNVVYFESEEKADFSRDELEKVGQIISRLMRFEPESRASADDILKDPWFADG
ncbi:Protein kinase domain-containing protein 21 [Elsinoe fawcettii]|nr:Protein kinase domain-containing protein 21 [Elsinoe fawcettii]